MSKQYDNELRGVLFKNDKKETDKHPDYKGNCQINGQEFWMAAWLKEGQNGKYMSFSFEAKEQKNAPKNSAPQKSQPIDDDSVPF